MIELLVSPSQEELYAASLGRHRCRQQSPGVQWRVGTRPSRRPTGGRRSRTSGTRARRPPPEQPALAGPADDRRLPRADRDLLLRTLPAAAGLQPEAAVQAG